MTGLVVYTVYVHFMLRARHLIIANVFSVCFLLVLCCTDEECHWENVRVLKDGETVSVDGTHLGKNAYCVTEVDGCNVRYGLMVRLSHGERGWFKGRVAQLDSSGELGAQVLLVAELIHVVCWLLFRVLSFNQCALVSHYFLSLSLYQ